MKLVWPLALAATGLTTLNAIGQSDQYVFDIIAETDPDGKDVFVSILSASMDADGAVAFAAVVEGETVPAVFYSPDGPCEAKDCVSIPNAVGPVLNNENWIVFLSLDDNGQIVDISRYDPTSKGGPVVVQDAGDEVLAGFQELHLVARELFAWLEPQRHAVILADIPPVAVPDALHGEVGELQLRTTPDRMLLRFRHRRRIERQRQHQQEQQ